MKKKLVICLCMTMLGLAGCGKESSEADVVLQDDMTTDEAIKYAQQLFAENVGDSKDMDELLDNMYDDAVEDFMGDGASEEEEETDVSVSSETEEEKQLYLEPTGMILADLPEGYEKVWELEEDNILVEFFELSDGDSTIAKITNKNPFDVNAHVEYRFKSAEPMDPNYQCLIAGDNTYVANQVYFDVVGRPMESDSWKDMNEGKDYYYLPDDEKVVEGLKFEIIEWNEEDFNLKYKITNNLDRNISLVDLKWILFDGSNVENVKYTRPVDGDERPLYPGESIVISENPYGLFNKETKKLMVSYCYDADSSDKDTTKEELASAIKEKRVEELLKSVPSKKGDVFFVEAGTIHGIGKGNLIAEIQQNSNVTYRLYDYGRVGKDGKQRELHINKGVEAANCKKITPKEIIVLDDRTRILGSCEYFVVKEIKIDGEKSCFADETTYHALITVDGNLDIAGEDFCVNTVAGETVFIPAGLGCYSLKGKATVLLTANPV